MANHKHYVLSRVEGVTKFVNGMDNIKVPRKGKPMGRVVVEHFNNMGNQNYKIVFE